MDEKMEEAVRQGLQRINHERYGAILRVLVGAALGVGDAMPSSGAVPNQDQWDQVKRRVYELVGVAYPLRRWTDDKGALMGDFNNPCPNCLGQGFMERDES